MYKHFKYISLLINAFVLYGPYNYLSKRAGKVRLPPNQLSESCLKLLQLVRRPLLVFSVGDWSSYMPPKYSGTYQHCVNLKIKLVISFVCLKDIQVLQWVCCAYFTSPCPSMALFYVWISMDKQHFIEGPFYLSTLLQSYCHAFSPWLYWTRGGIKATLTSLIRYTKGTDY